MYFALTPGLSCVVVTVRVTTIFRRVYPFRIVPPCVLPFSGTFAINISIDCLAPFLLKGRALVRFEPGPTRPTVEGLTGKPLQLLIYITHSKFITYIPPIIH